MSESWEHENKTLHEIIKLDDHTILSNVYQRKGRGDHLALTVNTKKFDVKHLTNTLINRKWGVEVVWCLLTPKNAKSKNKIKKIACASVFTELAFRPILS